MQDLGSLAPKALTAAAATTVFSAAATAYSATTATIALPNQTANQTANQVAIQADDDDYESDMDFYEMDKGAQN